MLLACLCLWFWISDTVFVAGLDPIVAAGLDSLETTIAEQHITSTETGDQPQRHNNNNPDRAIWGAAAVEGTKTLEEPLTEDKSKFTSTSAAGTDEKGRAWVVTPSVISSDLPKSNVVDVVLKNDDAVVEAAIPAETAHKKERSEESVPEKTGGSKRAWGASETTETHTKHAEDLSQDRQPSVSSTVSNNSGSSSSNSNNNSRVAFEQKPETTDDSPTKEGKRLWGSDHHPPKNEPLPPTTAGDEPDHIPFVAPSKHTHNPPEGFTLTARVYIGDDKLAHFDYNDDKQCTITLPYFDCGASGSTTAPVTVKEAYFRHSLSAPTVWNDPDMHPVLAVALAPFTMELDSGESLDFSAGAVILLEDSLRPGHRMMVVPDHHHSLSILFVTLPQPHYHTGKQHLSLKRAVAVQSSPCRTNHNSSENDKRRGRRRRRGGGDGDSDQTNETESSSDGIGVLSSPLFRRPSWNNNNNNNDVMVWDGRRIRRVVLATVALSISTLAADFLGKTAPLWLAVGIGGTCFVAGSTYGLTLAGDHIFTNLELWRERRRLEESETLH